MINIRDAFYDALDEDERTGFNGLLDALCKIAGEAIADETERCAKIAEALECQHIADQIRASAPT